MQILTQGSTTQGWLLVLVSSLACILGGTIRPPCHIPRLMLIPSLPSLLTLFLTLASIVFIDTFWPQTNGSILDNKPFLAASMALASGVLLFSSLAILLPESQERLGSAWKTYACFFAGSLFTLILTRLIHWCAPSAIHACGGAPHHPGQETNDDVEAATQERQPLLRHCDVEYGTSPNGEAHIRFHPPHQHLNEQQQQQHQLQQRQQQQQQPQNVSRKHQHDDGEGHDFLRIGIQTAVAIGVHKFPGKSKSIANM